MHKWIGVTLLTVSLIVAGTGCAKQDGVKTNQYKAKPLGSRIGGQASGQNGKQSGAQAGAKNGKQIGAQAGAKKGKQTGAQASAKNGRPGANAAAQNGGQTAPSAFDRQTSDVIARHAANVKGVRKATVLVHGREAIIGIDVKGGENRVKVENDVRRSIQTFKPGYRVHVTADKNLHARIQTIHAQSLKPLDGHPVRNFAQDVGILIRDIGRTATAPFRPK